MLRSMSRLLVASALGASVLGASVLGVSVLGVSILGPAAPARADDAPAGFSVAGSGWGHGVGMSQWGAYAQALEGRDAKTIVQHYYSGAQVVPVQDDMDVRVSLLHQVDLVKMRAEALEPGGGAIEVTVGDVVVTGTPADTFTFTASGPSVSVRRTVNGQGSDVGSAASVTVRWAGTRSPGTAAGGATLLNVAGPGVTLDSKGHRYRYGVVEVIAASSTKGPRLNVIDSLRMHDEYLYGVAEVSNSWPEAAMQAQVIAARSFALAKVNAGVRRSCSCHVDDGGGPFRDQTYAGWSKQADAQGARWTAAVDATAVGPNQGLAAVYNGAPISAFYTASTGGATQTVKDVWGGTLPYAVSVDDHWSLTEANPHRAWKVTVSQAAASRIFGLPLVSSLSITERVVSGAAKTVTATAPDGARASVPIGRFTSALGLRSRYLTAIDGQVGVPIPTPAAPPPVAPTPAPSNAGTPDATASAMPDTPPAAAPSPSLRITMKVGPTRSPKAGTRLVFTGRVTPRSKGVIVQRQLLVDGAWVVKATAKTKKQGRYRFVIKKAVPAGARYTYRVVAIRDDQVIGIGPERTITIHGKKGKKDKGKKA